MEGTDLRIGNHIQYKKGHQCKVTGIYKSDAHEELIVTVEDLDREIKYIDGSYEIGNMKPMSLSEEKLIEFGFNKRNNIFYKKTISIYWDDAKKVWFVVMNGKKITYVDYVHELQNLYHALTSIELDFV